MYNSLQLRLRVPRLLRPYSTQPPPARPYKGLPPKPAAPEPQPSVPEQPTSTPTKLPPEPLNPARGAAATLRYAKEGILDPRYKPASRKVTMLICAIPIFIVTSWVLYQRQVMGVERRKVGEKPPQMQEEDGESLIVVKEA